jgi:hypothetical protein
MSSGLRERAPGRDISRRVLIAAFALAVVSLLAWSARYQYVTAGSRVVRVNRWTGATAVLMRSEWRALAAPSATTADTSDPYADIVRK